MWFWVAVGVGAFLYLKKSKIQSDPIWDLFREAENMIVKLEQTGVWSDATFQEVWRKIDVRWQALEKLWSASEKEEAQRTILESFPSFANERNIFSRINAAKAKWQKTAKVHTVARNLSTEFGLVQTLRR